MHGVEVVRVQLSVDYRITPRLAIPPVVGVSASVFLVEDVAMPSDFTAVHEGQLNLYGFTGLLADSISAAEPRLGWSPRGSAGVTSA